MDKLSIVALPQTNQHHHVGKKIHCSSDQMTMLNLLAPQKSGFTKESRRGVMMPSRGVSLRSSQPQQVNCPSTNLPFPERRRVLRFDSQDSPSAEVGQEDLNQIYNCHQVSANQLAQNRSLVDSVVTFCDNTEDSNKFEEAYSPRNLLHVSIKQEDHNSSHKLSQASPRMISNCEREFQMKMKRKGSHDGSLSNNNNSSNNNNAMSVTSALRSRAIAIRPSNTIHPHDLEEQDAHASEQIYDQATWRMYNRIVDHRKNQLHRAQQGQKVHVTSSADNFQTLRPLESLNYLALDSIENDGSDNCPADDGEIFELDL